MESTVSTSDIRNVLEQFYNEFNVRLPDYLVQLLELCGWDNQVSLSLFTEEQINEMENFARNILPDLMDEQEKKKFYGIFFKKISLFKIPDGHKHLLLKFIESIKKKNQKSDLKGNCSCNRNISSEEKNKTNSAKDGNPNPKKKNTTNSTSNSTHSPKDHLLTLIKNYVKKFFSEGMQKDLGSDLTKDKCKVLENLDKIDIVMKDEWAQIKCIVCVKVLKAFEVSSRYGKKWVLSNYFTHLKGHFGVKTKKHTDTSTDATQATQSHSSSKIAKHHQTNLLSFVVLKDNDTSNQHINQTDFVNTQSTNEQYDHDSHNGSNEITMAETPPDTPLQPSCSNLFFSNRCPPPDTPLQPSCSNLVFSNRCMDEESREESNAVLTSHLPQNDEKSDLKSKNSTSRHERKLRTFDIFDEKQPKITSFFQIIDSLKSLFNNNDEVNSTFSKTFSESLRPATTLPTTLSEPEQNKFSNFLDILKNTAVKNIDRNSHGNRFSEPLKLFCLYIYIISGRLAYEMLYKNLPSTIPSLTTIHRTLDEGERVVEGLLRMEELKTYLIKRELPLSVFISEDQTAIVQTVQYEPKINQMVGFVPPLSNDNGFPKINTFSVNSVSDIEQAFGNNNLSKNAYFFMAQPLKDNVPAFPLCVFGSDNQFTAESVCKRWKYIMEQAKQYDIDIVGFSSDGDTRCLKAMKLESKLPTYLTGDSSCPYKPYFQMDFNPDRPIYIQDTVHIGTKLKTRFLKPKIILPMGKYHVSVSHIELMIDTISKDKHFLCKSFLESSDKMNFEAIDKMSSRQVIALMDQIPESNATKQYLLLTRNILDSFLLKNVTILDRIYQIWNSIFFIRIWKDWIKQEKFCASKNFLTSNIYTSIELNGHAILLLIEKSRKNNGEAENILPWLCSSQPCEKTFRQTRSMTSTFSTIVNFSMSDVMNRLKRIQTLNEISNDLGDSFYFPREQEGRLGKSINQSNIQTLLPSQEAILDELKKALQDAEKSAENLGMHFKKSADDSYNILVDIITKNKLQSAEKNVFDLQPDKEQETLLSESEQKEIEIFSTFESLNLKDYSNIDSNKRKIHKDTPFLKVVLNNKKEISVRKSSLCWFFATKKGRLSTDRTIRVRGVQNKSNAKGRKPKNPGKRRKKNSESECVETEVETDSPSESICLKDTSASDGSVFEENIEEVEDEDQNIKINIECEKYYAVFYDCRWELGRVIKIENDKKCTVKFLKEDLSLFIWPKKDLVYEINTKFLFYGPVNLEGIHPFVLKRYEKLEIEKLYKKMKCNT